MVATQSLSVATLTLEGMDARLRRRKSKDKPTLSCVYVQELKHIAKKYTVGFRVFTVKKNVSARKHMYSLGIHRPAAAPHLSFNL